MRQDDELSTFLQLPAQSFELLRHLNVASPRLARLTRLPPSKTDIRVHVVRLLLRLELEAWMQRLVSQFLSKTTPMVIDCLGMLHDGGRTQLIQPWDHKLIPDYRVVYGGKRSLLGLRALIDIHDVLKLILRELAR